MFLQYEVWGTLDGHEELLECVSTLKEAELVAEDYLEFNEEIYIVEDKDGEFTEVRRLKGLIG